MNVVPILVIAAACLAGCGAEPESSAGGTDAAAVFEAAADPTCRVVDAGVPLPDVVRESSGLARSSLDPDIFWTHNDAGNEPDLFAVDAGGRLVQRVRVRGADAADWEDIESGPCDEGACLYVADVGDNDGERESITIYRIAEPESGDSETAAAVALHARFPDGARDAESLFVLPSGDLYVVTKGRREPVGVYRYPAPQRPGEIITLDHVRELMPEPEHEDDRVTAATASPDGRWVGIRSYRTLYLYRADELVGAGPAEPVVIDLAPLGQAQGESLAIADDGSVWLTSEADGRNGQPRWARLACTLPSE